MKVNARGAKRIKNLNKKQVEKGSNQSRQTPNKREWRMKSRTALIALAGLRLRKVGREVKKCILMERGCKQIDARVSNQTEEMGVRPSRLSRKTRKKIRMPSKITPSIVARGKKSKKEEKFRLKAG